MRQITWADVTIKEVRHKCGCIDCTAQQKVRPWNKRICWWWCPRCDTTFKKVRRLHRVKGVGK